MIDIALRDGERGALIGMTGTGKSTLATDLIWRWRRRNPQGIALLIDSKPRFRASHGANGLPISYANWATGDTFPDSVAVHDPREAKEAVKLARTLIYQQVTPSGHLVANFERGVAELAEWLFRKSGRRTHSLFYVDEYYDILRGAAGIADMRVLRTIRAGRERYMTVLTGSQRPRSIPLSTLTEATNVYCFQLEFTEDIRYLQKHGVPIASVPTGYDFLFYRRERGGKRVQELCRLNVETKAA